MSPDKIECAFCGNCFRPGKRGEDVSPRWYAKHVGHPTTGEVTLGTVDLTGDAQVAASLSVRRSQTIAAKEFRLQEVCPACNNGWMSRLEQRVAPLLKVLTVGEEHVTLSDGDRRALASWCQLKAMCWDRILGEPAIPGPMLRDFGTVAAPAHAVVLGSRVESNSPANIGFARHRPGAPGLVEFLVQLHHFTAIVRFVVGDSIPVELLGSAPAHAFVGIWPPNAFPHVAPPTLPAAKVWEFNELLGFLTGKSRASDAASGTDGDPTAAEPRS